MENKLPPLLSWQFFHACRKVLGDSCIQKIYKRSLRQIYRWSADPTYADQVERNPIDRLKLILEKLCEVGREDIATAGVNMLAEVVGCELRKIDRVEPDQESIEDECLDDYPALTAFHTAIREGEPREVVRHHWQKAKQELDETWERYMHSLSE